MRQSLDRGPHEHGPDERFSTKDLRLRRVLQFMEARHFLTLARRRDDQELVKMITEHMRFDIRITGMFREQDPTSKIVFAHYRKYFTDAPDVKADALAELVLNVVFVRNTMGLHALRAVEENRFPWLCIQNGRITNVSKEATSKLFLERGNVFSNS